MASLESVFTFDVQPFISSIQKMENAMSKSVSVLKGLGDQIVASITKAYQNVVSGLAQVTTSVFSVNSAMASMPGVAEGINVIKEVFMRNFYYPLYLEIMPLLQKLMDWVTDNRALFLKWGTYVADAMRVVYAIAVQVFEALQRIMKVVDDAMRSAFGLRDMDHFVESMILNITMVLMFLIVTAERVINFLTPWVAKILNIFWDLISHLFRVIEGIGSTLADIGKTLGELFFKVLAQCAEFLKGVMDIVADTIVKLWDVLKPYVEEFDKFTQQVFNFLLGLLQIAADTLVRVVAIAADTMKKLWDVVSPYLGNILGIVDTVSKMFTDVLAIFAQGLVDIVAALVPLLPQFEKTLNDIRPFVSDVAQAMADVAVELAKGVAKVASTMLEYISSIAQAAHETGVMQSASNLLKTAVRGAAEAANELVKGVGDLALKVVSFNQNNTNLTTFINNVQKIVDVVGRFVASSVKGFFEGFNQELTNIANPLTNLAGKIDSILRKILGEDGTSLQGAFKLLGKGIGSIINTIVSTLNVLLTVVMAIVDTIKTVMADPLHAGEKVKALWSGQQGYGAQLAREGSGVLVSAHVDDLFQQIAGSAGRILGFETELRAANLEMRRQAWVSGNTGREWTPEMLGFNRDDSWGRMNAQQQGEWLRNKMAGAGYRPQGNVRDAIVTKTGQVIETDPEDNIYAFKSLGGGKGFGTVEVRMGDFNVYVTEGDAAAAGQAFAAEFSNEFAQRVSEQLYRSQAV